MATPSDPLALLNLAALRADATALEEAEVQALYRLRGAGIPVAPLLIVPAAVEERFYRLNTLASKLEALFKQVDLDDPDEDDVEDLAPQALSLFKSHFLLDEFIDLFYEAVSPLPTKVRVRRAGAAGTVAIRGQPALVALKQVWAADWTFDALMTRLGRTASIALEARSVLIGPAGDTPADVSLLPRLQAHVPAVTKVWVDGEQRVTRLELGPSPS